MLQTAIGYYIDYFCFFCCLLDRGRGTRSTADRIMKLEKFKYYFIMSTPVVMIADIIIHFLK